MDAQPCRPVERVLINRPLGCAKPTNADEIAAIEEAEGKRRKTGCRRAGEQFSIRYLAAQSELPALLLQLSGSLHSALEGPLSPGLISVARYTDAVEVVPRNGREEFGNILKHSTLAGPTCSTYDNHASVALNVCAQARCQEWMQCLVL